MRLLLPLALALAVTPASAQHLESAFSDTQYPTSASVSAGDVYGVVKYTVARPANNETNRAFWTAATSSVFRNTREGNYILVLEIRKPDNTVVAREVLAEYKISERRTSSGNIVATVSSFLGFSTGSTRTDITTNTSWSGTIFAPGVVVRGDNNNLRAVFSLNYSDSSAFDGSLFSELSKAATTLAAVVPAFGAVTPVSSLIDQLLGKYERAQVLSNSDSQGMSFIVNNQPSPGYNKITYALRIPGKQTAFRVTTSFDTVSSVLNAFDVGAGVFSNPSVEGAISRASIGGTSLMTALSKNEQLKPLVKFFTEGGNAPGNITASCNALYDEISKSFTTRDTTLLYWALLRKYETSLKAQPGHETCLPSFRQTEMARLGLDTSVVFASAASPR